MRRGALAVPAEGLLNTVLVRSGVHEIDGVPVLDSYAALLAHAEMLVRLRRASGRPRRHERIPQPIDDQLRRATAAMLLRPPGPA